MPIELKMYDRGGQIMQIQIGFEVPGSLYFAVLVLSRINAVLG